MGRQPLMISYSNQKQGRRCKKKVEAGGISIRKRAWSTEEDQKLIAYIQRYGIWNWNHMAKPAGLARTGKSCRLRWVNYLKPNVRLGNITKEEEEIIIRCHQLLGNKWTEIASKLEGRTDNEVKNYWHTHIKKRVQAALHKPIMHDNNNKPPSLLNKVDHSNIIILESLTQVVNNETANNSTTPNSESDQLGSLVDYSMPNELWAKEVSEQLFADAMVESSPDTGTEFHSFGDQILSDLPSLEDIVWIQEDFEAMSMVSTGFTLPYSFEESLSNEYFIYDLWGN